SELESLSPHAAAMRPSAIKSAAKRFHVFVMVNPCF
ncbi:MAG: hypothetical protein ACI8TP_005310, partial [Acidimicrobiales bacterium]